MHEFQKIKSTKNDSIASPSYLSNVPLLFNIISVWLDKNCLKDQLTFRVNCSDIVENDCKSEKKAVLIPLSPPSSGNFLFAYISSINFGETYFPNVSFKNLSLCSLKSLYDKLIPNVIKIELRGNTTGNIIDWQVLVNYK